VVLSDSRVDLREVEPDHADALRLVEAYFAELRLRLGSFKAPSLDELRAEGERGVTLVCYDHAIAVGCGTLRRLDPTTAEVKRMFVVPEARGRGHARRILRAIEDEAASLGCTRVVLDTAAQLTEAARLYVREGYAEVERYNDNPYAALWFEKQLVRAG
jgi:GNAT superfamily N-acetyltransferase